MTTNALRTTDLEHGFNLWLVMHPDIPEPVREHRFHPTRKWRFDFCWPDRLVAVEIEGVTYQGGRHQTVKGFIDDCEKYEAAMMLGWRVYRVPGRWVARNGRIGMSPESDGEPQDACWE